MKRTKIYISLLITGLDIKKVREKADLIKSKLSREGHTPVSPFDIYPGKNPTYADHICCDLRALMDCDGIYMCPGWDLSLGCNIEYATVRLMNHHAQRYGFKKKLIIYGKA